MGENDDGIFMERRNDALVEKLSGKVAALKKITIAIGDDVREQNRLLNEMETDFDASKGLLGLTMRKLDRVAKTGGKHLTSELFSTKMMPSLDLWAHADVPWELQAMQESLRQRFLRLFQC
ncbi:Uncharacterized protein BM_BM6938 [Brugia malayi]|nr:Uncharacterized protein BM_BM6938 [Brugia malayi]VIO87922.1 Uncharacterized protein BM_BM6938 [Brugia malayi]